MFRSEQSATCGVQRWTASQIISGTGLWSCSIDPARGAIQTAFVPRAPRRQRRRRAACARQLR
eukprot:2559842-Pyramimonas_sp.AAC.1